MKTTTLCCPLHFGPAATRPTLVAIAVGDGTGRAVLACTTEQCDYWTMVSSQELERLTAASKAA